MKVFIVQVDVEPITVGVFSSVKSAKSFIKKYYNKYDWPTIVEFDLDDQTKYEYRDHASIG